MLLEYRFERRRRYREVKGWNIKILLSALAVVLSGAPSSFCWAFRPPLSFMDSSRFVGSARTRSFFLGLTPTGSSTTSNEGAVSTSTTTATAKAVAAGKTTGTTLKSLSLTTLDEETDIALPLVVVPTERNSQRTIQLPLYQLALAGGLATLFSDGVVHPIDCVKTLQQSSVGMHMTFFEASQSLWETSGLAGFYHGFVTYGLSDATGGAVKFGVWESWKQTLMMMSERTAGGGGGAQDTTHLDQKQQEHQSLLESPLLFVGAGIAFLASSIIIVPGELLKQRLQMSYYENVWQALSMIVSSEGLRGLYHGYDGVLYRDIPYTMLELGLYELLKTAFDQRLDHERNEEELASVEDGGSPNEAMAAALTGAIAGFLTTPLDSIKTKLMVDDACLNGGGFMDCLLTTVNQYGQESLFTGVLARMCWISVFCTLYLPLYDELKRRLLQRHQRYVQGNNFES